MDTVLRSFAADIDDINKTERSIVAKISVGCVDRYRTVIDPGGINLKEFQANPVVLFAHGKDPLRGELPIGRNLWIKLDRSGNGRLIAKTKFAKDDFSQNLYELYADGTMRGWSVSIYPNEYSEPTKEEIRSRPDLEKCEMIFRASNLLEYSAVSVPGCAEALSIDEARSVSVLISRGIPIPDDIKEAVERLSETMTVQESTGLILPETATEPASEDRNADCDEPDEDDRKPSGHDDEDEDDDEDVEKRYIKHEGGKWVIYSEKGKRLGEYDSEEAAKKRLKQIEYFKHKDGDRSAPEPEEPKIELPPLVGRTFQQVYYRLMQDETEYRTKLIDELNARIDWMCGKV